MVSINMREMLEAGVHFGHQVRRWNPKMKPYIYGKKNGIYIINLQTSIELFKDALQYVTDTVAQGGQALIVGTKKQAQSIIEELGEQAGMHYVNKRWLGGLLTNFPMIKKSIDKLIDLDEMKRDGRWDVKSKKEQSRLEKVYKKLHKNLWGLRSLHQLPSVVIVVDAIYESIAISEARKLGIPIVAIVDTNANPEIIDFPIPGNDDAIRSIRLFVSKFGEAVQEGLKQYEEARIAPVAEPDEEEPAEAAATESPENPETAESAEEPGEKAPETPDKEN